MLFRGGQWPTDWLWWPWHWPRVPPAIGAKPNLYSEAIELVRCGPPIGCILVERKARRRGKWEQQQHRTSLNQQGPSSSQRPPDWESCHQWSYSLGVEEVWWLPQAADQAISWAVEWPIGGSRTYPVLQYILVDWEIRRLENKLRLSVLESNQRWIPSGSHTKKKWY